MDVIEVSGLHKAYGAQQRSTAWTWGALRRDHQPRRARPGLLRPEITTFSLEEALDACRQLAAGTSSGRGVVVPDQ